MRDWSGQPSGGNPLNGMRLSGKYGRTPPGGAFWGRFVRKTLSSVRRAQDQPKKVKTAQQINQSHRKAYDPYYRM